MRRREKRKHLESVEDGAERPPGVCGMSAECDGPEGDHFRGQSVEAWGRVAGQGEE